MEYALDLISQGRLVLVAPSIWDDPYENLFQKHTAEKTGNNPDIVMRWYGADLFGSCWTWIPESDFAWRVYVPKGEIGVIIETKVEKLLDAVRTWGGPYAGRDCFVGQVHYWPSEEILAAISSEGFQRSNNSSDTAHIRAAGLLLKRPEFEHEREVRVIVECPDQKRRRDSVLVDVPIDPNELVEGLTIDPRIDKADFDLVVENLREAGFKGDICQSELYRLPWERTQDLG